MHPSVDVIIPTYRPGPELRGLLRQTVVPEHIFLVNTEEAAFDSALIENLPRVSICHIPKKAFFCSNVAALYDRAYLLAGGGFYVPSIFNEDMVFAAKALRAGAAVAYAADARVIHSHNYSARQQFHRNFDNGVSQARHPEAFEGVGSAGEGKKLVVSTLKHLLRTGHPLLVPKLFLHSAAKLSGFYLGRHYHRLPKFVVRVCTDNRGFWDKDHEAAVREFLNS